MENIKKLLEFGIINIDKPSGPTSFTISDFVREKLSLNKTSHLGTLDPKVTGVLPIALGRACRLAGFFLGGDKTYIGIVRVHSDVSIEELQEIINKNFLGKIKQLPPRKSSVKRAIREREIKSFEILEKEDKNFLFLTEVQGGTYIRKLCSDLGEYTNGAHMIELRRIQASIFNEEDSFNLYQFQEAVSEYMSGNSKKLEEMIIPAEEVIKKAIEVVQLKKSSLKKALTGKPLDSSDFKSKPKNDKFAIFLEDRFIEIAEKDFPKADSHRPLFVYN